ncbi:MAG: nuclear transport factor 2 family protein [Acidobacteriota bacterium]|nr:nuclear transport factor 2 family protein [Acidobacteriota bacterium]
MGRRNWQDMKTMMMSRPLRSFLLSVVVFVHLLVPAEPPEAARVVRSAILAVNTGDLKAVANLYTPDAMIVDEDAPYVWTGSGAGGAWLQVVGKATSEAGLTGFKGELGAIHYSDSTRNAAYVVVPVTYTGLKTGKRYREEGAFSFALQRVSGHWLIKGQSWATLRLDDGSQAASH